MKIRLKNLKQRKKKILKRIALGLASAAAVLVILVKLGDAAEKKIIRVKKK